VSLNRELAAKWLVEVEQLEERAAYWETGKLRAYENDVDVTNEQAPMLRRNAQALREAIVILESEH
jgi:hypothetical protein